MTKKLLASFVLTIIFAMQVYAQGRTVSGKVADKKGEAIPGANIVVKGNTALATVSVDNGTFSLANVPDNATIIVTASTFTDIEIQTGTNTVVNVTMNADDDLNTVEVVGAVGIIRNKASMNTGVSIIDGAAITEGKSFSAAQGLTGKIAGLQINTTSSGVNAQSRIILRGSRSILGNNEALVVIDGSQSTQSAFSQINPGDIESMTVLKGQAAAALYGSDAANGVLMVTTKKGSVGTRVTFSTTQQFDRISFLPKFQQGFGTGTGTNSEDYYGGENQSFGPAYDGSIRGTGGPGLSPMKLEDGTINTLKYAYLKDSKLNAFNTGTRLQNEVSISGGNENTKFYLSAEDIVQKGIVDGDKYRRTGVRFNAQTSSNKLTAGFTASYNTGLEETIASNLGNSFYFLALNTAGNIPLRDYRNWQNFTNPDGSLNPANPNNYYNEYYANPWFTLDNNRETTRTNNFVANVSLAYKVTDWLTFTYRPGITNTNSAGKIVNGKYEYRNYSKSVLNRSIAKDLAGGVTDNSGYQIKVTQDALLTFNPKFTPTLETTLILGSNINDNSAQNTRIVTTSIVVPGLGNVTNRLGEPVVSPQFNRISQSRTTSVFADLSLGYKKIVYLQVSGRNEWTSLLDKGDNSYFFPGANLSVVVSNLIPALKESNVLTFAKITGSAGKVGQVSLGAYGTRSIFNAGGGFPYGSQPGFTVGNNVVQKGIKPEFTTAYEVGAELAFFDRVNLEASIYKTETVNQTLSLSLPQSSGFTQQTRNVGATETKGLEVTLRGDVIKAARNNPDGLNWNVGANYSYRDNVVSALFDETKEIRLDNAGNGSFGGADNTGGIFAIVGQQYPMLKVTSYQRDPQGRVILNPATGYPLANSGLAVAGQTSPKHSLGINTTLSYKGFSFFALAEYRAGNVFYHDLGHALTFTGNAAVTANYDRQRFVFPNSSFISSTASDGTGATYVANTSVTTKDGGWDYWDNSYKKFGENFVTSGAFWKLREARLTYKLPDSALESMSKYIKGASVSFVGRNLLIFVPKTNQFSDPEFGDSVDRGQFAQQSSNTPNATGVSTDNQVPTTRTYGFNITITL